MSCTEIRTHTDGKRGLCSSHGHAAKTAGAEVSLAPASGARCQWIDSYEPPVLDQEQPVNTDPTEEA